MRMEYVRMLHASIQFAPFQLPTTRQRPTSLWDSSIATIVLVTMCNLTQLLASRTMHRIFAVEAVLEQFIEGQLEAHIVLFEESEPCRAQLQRLRSRVIGCVPCSPAFSILCGGSKIPHLHGPQTSHLRTLIQR